MFQDLHNQWNNNMSINDFHLSSDKPFKPRLSSKFNDSLTYNTNLGYVRSIVVEQFP